MISPPGVPSLQRNSMRLYVTRSAQALVCVDIIGRSLRGLYISARAATAQAPIQVRQRNMPDGWGIFVRPGRRMLPNCGPARDSGRLDYLTPASERIRET